MMQISPSGRGSKRPAASTIEEARSGPAKIAHRLAAVRALQQKGGLASRLSVLVEGQARSIEFFDDGALTRLDHIGARAALHVAILT